MRKFKTIYQKGSIKIVRECEEWAELSKESNGGPWRARSGYHKS